MNATLRSSHLKSHSIPVDQLRAGDWVELGAKARARVILVEKADQDHVLVAYEGADNVDYPVGASVSIKPRRRHAGVAEDGHNPS